MHVSAFGELLWISSFKTNLFFLTGGSTRHGKWRVFHFSLFSRGPSQPFFLEDEIGEWVPFGGFEPGNGF